MRARAASDRGAAAVEFALLLSVMLAVFALLVPLGELFVQKMWVGRAAAVGERFATADPSSPDYGATTSYPTLSQVQQAALDAYQAAGGSATGFSTTATLSSVPGSTVTVTATKAVDMGVLAPLLELLQITNVSTVTVSATASGREE